LTAVGHVDEDPRARAGQGLRPVSSWGRLSSEMHAVVPLNDRSTLDRLILDATPGLPHGNGRSYGDACLNPGGRLWLTRGLDRFIGFDAECGTVECEAGVLLKDIVDVALPRGWFLPVTPGTQFVTLGGAIANDVHGKNHHSAGTLGEHVESLVLRRTDGTVIECTAGLRSDWLRATIGGLGLTGLIVSARLKLKPVPGPWLDAETITFASLDEFFTLSADSEQAWEYGVAWIDCIGGRGAGRRGVFFRANHVGHDAMAPPARARSIPLTPPVSLINSVSLRLFNAAYYRANRRRSGRRVTHYMPFFYPLDNVRDWNRIYGPRGFYQYQCVVPRRAERAATAEMLGEIAHAGTGSFLAVLKTFGDRAPAGMLSFPMAGTTLALDFPNLGGRTHGLFERLNAIVRAAGGRLYPAKDACMPRDMFECGYPRLAEFASYRDAGISSAMSRRLIGS
jgi:FAD/FMN-containing dehydrogenase